MPVSSSPSGVVQRWPGWMTTCGGVRRVVGDDVRVRPAQDRDVAARQPDGLAAVGDDARRPADDRDERQRRLVLDPHRPRRVEVRAEEERVPGARPVEKPTDRIHADRRRSRMDPRS